MSQQRQLSLENYFGKSKARSSHSSDVKMHDTDKKCKKRNLSLNRQNTPTKSTKVSENNRNVPVVNLCSDDEDIPKTPCNLSQRSNVSEESVSAASDNTVTYYLTPESPKKAPSSFSTPQKSSRTPVATTLSQTFRSPQSRDKYFSPTKNRSVVKRTPVMKAKRSLSMEMSNTALDYIEYASFTAACKDMDDKTIFLLAIINKFINDSSLRHLLDSDAQTLLENCLEVVKPGMRLVCRLYWRKEGWYKREQVSQISCEGKKLLDDSSLDLMLESLVKSGLVTKGDDCTMGFDELKKILNRDELIQTCKNLKLKVSSKQDAVEALEKFSRRSSNITNFITGCKSSNWETVLKIMSSKAGSCYKLSDFARTTLYNLYILMYLGMDYSIIREKKLELVLIYDKVGRETYPVDKGMALDSASIVFQSREEFERYLTAHNIYEDFLNESDCAKKCNTVKQVYRLYSEIGEDHMLRSTLPPWLRRYTPAYVYVKILEAGIQDLKKEKDGRLFLLALDILTALIAQNAFRQHRKAEWYAEKALILHSLLYRCDEAAEVLLQGFKSDMSEEAKDSMRPRARKIANQKSVVLSEHLKKDLLDYSTKENILENNLPANHVYKQPMDRTSMRGKVKFEKRTAEGRMVLDAESYCIAHYLCNGFTDGEHWEGRIVTTMFFLLFWDIIYSQPAGVRGVFLTHYQKYPLDLFSASFYANRKAAIDDWLGVIERATEDKLLKMMHDTWTRRPEGELSGIHRALGWDDIRAVASCLGPRGLAALCGRLATNYTYAHSGFPDLTLWNRHTKQIKFVEVKTDSDKPSMKQIQWMHYLVEHDIDTEFCYLGVNTTRQRCRTGSTPLKKVKKEPRRRIKKENKKTMKMKVTASQDTIKDAAKIEVPSSHARVKDEPKDEEEIEVFCPQVGDKEPRAAEETVISSQELELTGSVKSEVTSSPSPLKEITYSSSQVKVKEPKDAERIETTFREDTLKNQSKVAVKAEISCSEKMVKKELLDEAISPCVSLSSSNSY